MFVQKIWRYRQRPLCVKFCCITNLYLEPDAVSSKLTYIQHMLTQVVACVFFIYAAIMTLLICVEMVTFIFKSPHREDSEMFWKFVCNFQIRVSYT
jgi:hypothetical protein